MDSFSDYSHQESQASTKEMGEWCRAPVSLVNSTLTGWGGGHCPPSCEQTQERLLPVSAAPAEDLLPPSPFYKGSPFPVVCKEKNGIVKSPVFINAVCKPPPVLHMALCITFFPSPASYRSLVSPGAPSGQTSSPQAPRGSQRKESSPAQPGLAPGG